jgi:hypothetical protein
MMHKTIARATASVVQKSKLAKHSALLEQMQRIMAQQGGLMKNISGMMTASCPMMGGDATPPTR